MPVTSQNARLSLLDESLVRNSGINIFITLATYCSATTKSNADNNNITIKITLISAKSSSITCLFGIGRLSNSHNHSGPTKSQCRGK